MSGSRSVALPSRTPYVRDNHVNLAPEAIGGWRRLPPLEVCDPEGILRRENAEIEKPSLRQPAERRSALQAAPVAAGLPRHPKNRSVEPPVLDGDRGITNYARIHLTRSVGSM